MAAALKRAPSSSAATRWAPAGCTERVPLAHALQSVQDTESSRPFLGRNGTHAVAAGQRHLDPGEARQRRPAVSHPPRYPGCGPCRRVRSERGTSSKRWAMVSRSPSCRSSRPREAFPHLATAWRPGCAGPSEHSPPDSRATSSGHSPRTTRSSGSASGGPRTGNATLSRMWSRSGRRGSDRRDWRGPRRGE